MQRCSHRKIKEKGRIFKNYLLLFLSTPNKEERVTEKQPGESVTAQETAVQPTLLSATRDFLCRKCPCGVSLSAPDMRATSNRTWEALSCHRLPRENRLSQSLCLSVVSSFRSGQNTSSCCGQAAAAAGSYLRPAEPCGTPQLGQWQGSAWSPHTVAGCRRQQLAPGE